MEWGQSQVGGTRMRAGKWNKLFLKRTTRIGGHGGPCALSRGEISSLALMF